MQLQINENKRELKAHGCFEYPVLTTHERLSMYERGAFIWHWHPEVELTLIIEGSISYQVNDQIYVLHEGEALFCNSNALHTGHMIGENDCRYISTTFHPRMIYGYQGSVIQSEYVDPIITSEGFSSMAFLPQQEWQRQVIEMMRRVLRLNTEQKDAYELLAQQALSEIWVNIYLHADWRGQTISGVHGRDVERLRGILTYIQEHFAERITLDDIAAQINICKSECCRFFKKHMKQSLFDYLLNFRIEKSLVLLAEDTYTVTEIAEKTGFTNPSYFAKIFKTQMGCSPSAYKKRSTQSRT